LCRRRSEIQLRFLFQQSFHAMTDFISRRDLNFNLFELQGLASVLQLPRFAQHDRETCEAMLDAALTLASAQFQPHAAKSDASEPHFDGERVHIIPEVKQALDAYIAAGFLGASVDAADGGLQLPSLFCSALATVFSAANIGTCGYTFLTAAAANLIHAHGSIAQKDKYMRPMHAGRFFGTMCLSEPQAGSSLADIKTRAAPRADGRYSITGNKMWISGGEHDLSENIVHMVLARIEGAPAGVKGISLFIVPKKIVNDDGSLGARNGVRLIGLNHKMGYRGTVNTALAFGDGEECIGERVGEPHKGLACMFHMMNEARIGVGMGAVALGYAGYCYALEYSKGRPQGRPPSNKDPASPPVAIIEHVDVRRMLLAQKTYVEGGLALGLYCARLVDEQHSPDEMRRREADTLLGILTPIVKSWPSEYCLEANKLAIQCLGGYGYTRDYPVERLYRDNRLNHIHEGTYGIQGLDLLGRKVMGDGGKALKLLSTRILATATVAAAVPELAAYARDLQHAVQQAGVITATLGAAAAKGNVDLALSNATLYLDMLGHTVMAWLWLQQALVATRALAEGTAETDFYNGKLAASRYFYLYELPKTAYQQSVLAKLDDVLLKVSPAQL
jgi:butyryl-CoA dehydrogenase